MVFEKLLKESELFSKYYHDVRPQIGEFVVVHDSNLPVGIRARTTRLKDGKRYLRLHTPVWPVELAWIIAHELGHFLLDDRGFPGCESVGDHSAAAALNSALHDPLVDTSLRTYGFDVISKREEKFQRNMQLLGPISQAPTDRADKALWIANHLGFILEHYVLGDAPGDSNYAKWFDSRYPRIVKQAELVAAEVISMGFDTPEKMFAALERARVMLDAGEGVILPPVKS